MSEQNEQAEASAGPEIPHQRDPEPPSQVVDAPDPSSGPDTGPGPGGEGEQSAGAGKTVDPEEVEKLRKYKEFAGYLMRDNDPTLTSRKREALTYIMEMEGYGKEEIYRYLDAMEQQQNAPQMEPSADEHHEQEYPDMGTAGQPLGGEEVRGNEEIAELRAEIERLRGQHRQETTQILRGKLNDALKSQIEGGVGGLMQTVERLNPEGKDAFQESIKADLERELIDRLQKRKNTTGTFDVNWVDEEASRATESLVRKYRAVIGDPDRVARVPETDAGSDGIKRVEPPKDPSFDASRDDMATVSGKARSYTEQALRSLADEVDKGGKTVM